MNQQEKEKKECFYTEVLVVKIHFRMRKKNEKKIQRDSAGEERDGKMKKKFISGRTKKTLLFRFHIG